ncbi:helix-turn-helix transcriptional regulator [Thioclava sp. BHET1]|nr:helix-turn-helix transcriptional regulator [Thioclava sp. BHET1]
MKDFVAISSNAASLLESFAAFRRPELSGTAPHGQGLFSYCTLVRERLRQINLPHPILGVVLSGTKEIWRGLDQETLTAGTLFALPAGVDIDIVNDPDPERGTYQSLLIEVTPEMTAGLPRLDVSASRKGASIDLTPELIEALSHAAMAIASGPMESSIRRARIAELLALLATEPAAGVLFDSPVADRLAQLVRSQPDHPWTSDQVAHAIGMSESTLRRRLRDTDDSFSAILRRERMQIARRMLGQGMASGLVASAVGYASRAHFARAFRDEFGHNPRHTLR